MKISIEKIVLYIAVITAVFFLFAEKCSHKKTKGELITANRLAEQKTDSVKNLSGQVVYLQEVVKADKQSLKEYTDSIFNLQRKHERKIKEVIAFYSSRTKIEIKDRLVPYVDTVERKRFSDSVETRCQEVIQFIRDSTVIVPKVARDSTSEHDVSLTVTKAGVKIDSISIVDTQSIRFVKLKGGFLKKDQSGKRHLFLKKSYQVQVLHSNPAVKVTGQSSAILIPNSSNILPKAVGIAIGIFIGTKL